MKEKLTYEDNFLRELFSKVELETPSDEFTGKVMNLCYQKEIREVFSFAKLAKKYSWVLLPILFVLSVIFIPGLSGWILSIFTKFSWMSIVKYYTISSIVSLTVLYVILSERIIKYIRQRRLEDSLLHV